MRAGRNGLYAGAQAVRKETDLGLDPTDLVIVETTSQVNANGDLSVTFTAQNQGGNLGLGDYIYCFEITAADGAERKDGGDDGVEVSSDAGKDLTWQ